MVFAEVEQETLKRRWATGKALFGAKDRLLPEHISVASHPANASEILKTFSTL